ncbi:hypothetical protein [Acrocarpospora sp. B8E8]|uniref:hypothetical protein n=1 Tax=Acrocarpospora sp. B8E8 TaxID=3153572 RepID=UPI00325F5434
MNTVALSRTHQPEKGVIFLASPYGGDFEKVHKIISDALQQAGMKSERLDGLYGPTAIIQLLARSIQRAEVVIVDCTDRNANVAFELGISLMYGKKVVMISQNLEDVPSDYRGHRILTYSLLYEDVERFKEELIDQIHALQSEPSTEQTLAPLPGPQHVISAPATVIKVEKEYAIVRTDDPERPPVVLGNANVDITRLISDMTRRFKVGDRVNGSYTFDPIKGKAEYTLVPGQEDPWPELAKRFPAGHSFTGTVRTVVSGLGAFVEMEAGINGLVPERTVTGAVPAAGAQVVATVSRVDVPARKVSLRLERVLASAQPADALVGWRGYGHVVKPVPFQDGRGGFILLKIDGRERPAMLLAKDMSDDLRDDLSDGQVDLNEEIYVEVTHLDAARDKVLLRELPDPEEAAEQRAAA